MTKEHIKKPNFFIVGAPKCGTTFLYHYLKKHPDIFMPNFKEPHFFGKGLGRQKGHFNLSMEKYLELFYDANNEKLIGEASTFYIFSKTSAQEIYNFNPSSKIIIMLRNPVDLLYSLHSQVVFYGDEDIEDFEVALAYENERMKGSSLPKDIDMLSKVYYRNNLKNMVQNIEKFYLIFGPDKIHIILLEEIKHNPRREFKKVLNFLEVKNNFDYNFKTINPNTTKRFNFVTYFIKRYSIYLGNIRQLFYPRPWGIINFLKKINTINKPRKELNAQLKRDLSIEFAPLIRKIENITGKDLSILY